MKLLNYILNNSNKHLPIGSCLFISAIISGVAFAEKTTDGFPPLSMDKKIETTKKEVMPAKIPTPAVKYQQQATQNRSYYPQQQAYRPYPNRYPQQMQSYRAYPYAYYPQQQMPNYAARQWGYPQQRVVTPYPRYQPYPQNQAYRSYPIAPYNSNQNAYPSLPSTYQKNQPSNNTATNNIIKKRYPMRKKIKKEKHAWGDKRHIWPDFYTDFTGDLWDKMINAPYDVGRMPGGWRAPSLSTPDPATVSDAVANQIPPIVEEMGNMTNFTN